MPRDDETSQRREHCVSITLKADAFGALFMRSLELVRGDTRIRLSFSKDATIAEAFCAQAAMRVEEVAAAALERMGLLRLPDFVIRAADFVLADCSAVAADMEDGGQQIMLRFRDHYGDIMSLFSADAEARQMLAGRAPDHAIEALEQAYVPLFDIAGHIAELRQAGALDASEKHTKALLSISEKIEAMRVYRVIAKDLVAGKAVSHSIDATALRGFGSGAARVN